MARAAVVRYSCCGARKTWRSESLGHACPSPLRGYYWCATCRAWRYLNPSALAKPYEVTCWRCGSRPEEIE